jgi:YVTN family beta-propeller protein
VALTPDGTRAYVTVMNDNAVAVLDTASGAVRATIAVGKLPAAVAVTPDGSEAWVGNVFSGSVSVIDVASGAVVATIAGGTGTKPIDAAPVGIAFGRTPAVS